MYRVEFSKLMEARALKEGRGLTFPPDLVEETSEKAKALGLDVDYSRKELQGGNVDFAKVEISFERRQTVFLMESAHFKDKDEYDCRIYLNIPVKSWDKVAKDVRDLEEFGEEFEGRAEFYRKVSELIDYVVQKLRRL